MSLLPFRAKDNRAQPVADRACVRQLRDQTQRLVEAQPISNNRAIECYSHAADAPAWTIPYGKEFWRQPKKPMTQKTSATSGAALSTADINVGDAIERVSHALTFSAAEGAAHMDTGNYSAAFDSQGLRLTVPLAGKQSDEPAAPSEALFRTTEVRSGDQLIFKPGGDAPRWSILGNTAQALLDQHSGSIEHYETRSEGVAVTWIFREPLQGGQPLTVTAELSGLEYVGQTESGHHFADASGTARLRFGNAKVVDAQGREWDVPVTVSSERVSIDVSANILSEAAYPLAIDPILGPEFGIDNTLTPVAGHQRTPALAFNGGVFLVAWADERNTNSTGIDIWGTRVTPTATILDPGGIAISTAAANQDLPAVGSLGGDFLVTWQDQRNAGDRHDIYAARVSGGGSVLDPAGIALATGEDDDTDPAVAANASTYLVVWHKGSGFGTFGAPNHRIYGREVHTDGTSPSNTAGPIGFRNSLKQSDPCIASDGTKFLVAFRDTDGPSGQGIYAVGLSPSALPVEFPVSVAFNGNFQHPAVACSGSNYLVVFEYDLANADILGRIVTTNFFGGFAMTISSAPGNQWRPEVASNGKDYLAVWWDTRNDFVTGWDIYGTFITSTGRVVHPNGLPISATYYDETSPAVAAAGQDFLVVWDDDRNSDQTGLDIFGARVSGAANVLDPNGFLISTVIAGQIGPAIAFNGTEYLVAWADYRNNNTTNIWVMGLRLDPAGTVLDTAPIQISMSPGSKQAISVAAKGPDFLVVWEDGRNYSAAFGNIFGCRVDNAGAVLDPNGISISALPAHQTACKVAANANEYMVAWQDARLGGYGIFGSRVSTAGAVLDPSGIFISAGAGQASSPSIASDGAGYFVVWEDARSPLPHIFGTRLNSAGVPLDAGGIAMTTTNSVQHIPAIAFAGSQYLVAWYESRPSTTFQDIWGTRVSTAGAVLDLNGIPISIAPNPQLVPSIAPFGANFLVVWNDRRNNADDDIFASQVASDGSVLDPAGLPVNTNPLAQRSPQIAYAGGGKFLVVSYAQRNGLFRIAGNLITYPPNNYPAIPGLFNTGVNSSGAPLTDNSADPHYSLVSPSPVVGTPIVATSAGGFPIGPWVADNTISAWIAPTADTVATGRTDGSAIYRYETTFDLNGFDAATATIIGQWSTDNDGLDILINGISTGQANSAQFTTFTPFQITSGFNGGINRLTFVLSNGRGEPNGIGPTGLRVEMVGTAQTTLQPFIRSIEPQPGGGILITWGSIRRHVYQVLYKDELSDPSWRELSGLIFARTRITSYLDDTAPKNGRYYLVVLVE